MKRGFYVHFARDNIRKNRRLFLPFICTLAFMSAVFFLLNGLAYQPLWQSSRAGNSVVAMLQFGTVVMGLFSLIFLFYTHSMVIKQRKREFGLYSVLGMGKRHIVRILLTETLLTGLFGLVLGLLVGALFSYAGELLLLNLLRLPATAQFVFPWPSVLFTLVTFCAILLLIFANDARSVALTNTIDLLNSASEGEREPKAKVLLALLGAALLAGGAVSFAGLLGFVGLLVPHIARRLIGTDNRWLLPAAALAGAGFVLACDLAARLLFAPFELPVGIVMSLLGGPFFLGLLLRRGRGRVYD